MKRAKIDGIVTSCRYGAQRGGCSSATLELVFYRSSASEDAWVTSEEVVFWGPWDGEVGGQIEAIIDEYNTEKGTNVSYVCQADLVNAYQAAALAGDVPDIMLWDANEVRRYAKMGQLKSIDEELKADGIDTADFNDESIKELTYEDHLYGLPEYRVGAYVNGYFE
ncbi:MAG: extracellular solute-binding protein [[Clostridium] leptum]